MSRGLRAIFYFIFVLPVVMVIAFSDTSVAQITHQVVFSEDDLIFSKKDSFDHVGLKSGITTQAIGNPDLPIKVIHLLLPQHSEATGVSVLDEHHILLSGEYYIAPCQLDEKTDGSYPKELIVPNPLVYDSDSSYPGKLVEILDEGYQGGNHLVTLALYPLQYQPKSRQLFFFTQIDIRVEMRGSNISPVSSQIRRRTDKAEQMYEELLSKLVDNKNDIPSSRFNSCQLSSFKENADSSVYPYLIVTSPALKSAFLSLIEWKTKKGVKSAIVCMDSILSTYSGRDDAEKLRIFLISAYQNGTIWVLLGGDEDIVPIRYVYPSNTSTPPSNTDQQICDLYFSDVDGDWDFDHDGVWGEPQQDHPDLYPDLFVGRVPCSDTTEAKAFVEKLLSYEKNPGNGSNDYLGRSLWMSSDQMRDWNSGSGQHSLVSPYIPPSFTQDLSSLIESPTGGSENPIGPDGGICVETMNQGWGIIGVLAHGKSSGFVAKSNLTNGSPKSWVLTSTGGADGHGHLPNLSNDQKYGIMYSIACSQSAIDVDKYPFLGGEPCVGEFYPLVPQQGGVAFLGYSRWGWVSLSYLLFEKFLEYLSFGNPEHHLGIAEALSRCFYPSYRDIDYGHNLFGDPEMPVWTETPSNLTVTHPDEVKMGLQTINFSVSSQGSGVPDALVCLTLRGEIMFLGRTDPDGRLSAEMNFNDVGELSVVVTKPNFVPYEDSITITLAADVDDEDATSKIESFELSQNYPNPFNPVTNIQFTVGSKHTNAVSSRQSSDISFYSTIPGKSADVSPSHLALKIYNILGQLVKTLVNEEKPKGNYSVVWDGRDDQGKEVSSGIYFYTLMTDNYRITKKMTLLK